MSKLLAAALAAGVILAAAQENPVATHITAEDILATIANAPEGRVSDQQIRHIDAGGHNVGVGLVHRPPTTSLGAIQHHNQTEVYYVVSGRGTLVTGGELTDARPLDPEGNTVRTLTGPSTPGGIAGASFFSGFSATIASVVMSRPATEAASCSAVRTTLAGSMIPVFTMST